ncbi:glycosyltransferase [Thermostilla marina]
MAAELRGYNVAKALRRYGYATLVTNHVLQTSQKALIARLFRAHLIYMQKARHSTHSPRLFPSYRCILDIDDADWVIPRWSQRTNATARASFGIIAGSQFVADWAEQHCSRVEIIWTGCPPSVPKPSVQLGRPYTLLYASSNPTAYPDNLTCVLECFRTVRSVYPDSRLLIMGVRDSSQRDLLQAFAEQAGICSSTVELAPFLDFDAATRLASTTTVGLAPLESLLTPFERGKSFGKVLLYLAAGLPVVASAHTEYVRFFRHRDNGCIASGSQAFAQEVLWLLSDSNHWKHVARNARASFMRHLSLDAVARRYAEILAQWFTASDSAAEGAPAVSR